MLPTRTQPRPSSCPNPILIVGTERSGSNLLRLILNAHSRIVVPHPPHLVHYFRPLEDLYGDLEQDDRYRRFLNDVNRVFQTHIHPWSHAVVPSAVEALAPSRDAIGTFIGVYELARIETGKARWGCKSTFLIDHADAVLNALPGAQLILLVRDPRDVALSSKKSVFSPCHPQLTARLWRRQQDAGRDLLDRLPARMILLLRYEDFVATPEKCINRICDFLGESYEPGMLRFFETDEAQTSGALSESWRNTRSPIIEQNVRKFERELSSKEILMVEAECRQTMSAFDYETTQAANTQSTKSLRRRTPLRLALPEAYLRTRVELRSLVHDGNHWLRWRRAWTLASIRARLRMSRLLRGS